MVELRLDPWTGEIVGSHSPKCKARKPPVAPRHRDVMGTVRVCACFPVASGSLFKDSTLPGPL